MLRGPAGLAALLCLALVGAGCRGRTGRGATAPAAPAAGDASGGSGWYPASLAVERYAGAAACADCHRATYDAWRASPHGRAMAEARGGAVLGDFGGATTLVEGHRLTAHREGDRFLVRDQPPGEGTASEHLVELVIGSGRQHQLYLTRGADGGLRLLPIYWATRTREWVDTRLHRGTAMDPASPRHWLRTDVVSEGNCFYCHLSQGRARADGRRLEQAWVDLPIDCEACHGPARAHAEGRRAGRVTPPLPDLRALDNVREALLCGRCHAAQRGGHDEARADLFYLTLGTPLFRADGTQLGAGYQYAGHVMSGCYLRGSMTCSACHDPHAQRPRSLRLEDASDPHADRQCDACHRALLDESAARAHSHHRAGTRCIDCHMPRSSLFDDPAARQEVSDHAIAVPRPRETLELGLPNACTRCHGDHDAAWALAAVERWGQARATTVRPWVAALVRARRRDPDAVGLLLAAIADRATPPFAVAGALDLLGQPPLGGPPDARVAAVVAPLAAHPEPRLRGLALRALWVHDPPRREAWIQGALSDGNPIVRLGAIEAPRGAPLAAAAVATLERDLEAIWTVPPALALRELALVEARAGRPAGALRLLDRALAVATPRQLELGDLAALRARLAAGQAP